MPWGKWEGWNRCNVAVPQDEAANIYLLELVKLETRYNTSINKPVYILCMFVRKYVLHIDTSAEQFL